MTFEHGATIKRIIAASMESWHFLAVPHDRWMKLCQEEPNLAASVTNYAGLIVEPTGNIPPSFMVALDYRRQVVGVVDVRSDHEIMEAGLAASHRIVDEAAKETTRIAPAESRPAGKFVDFSTCDPAQSIRVDFEDAIEGFMLLNFEKLSALLAGLAKFKPLSEAETELQRPIVARHMQLMPAEDRSGSEVAAVDEPQTVERVTRRQWPVS